MIVGPRNACHAVLSDYLSSLGLRIVSELDSSDVTIDDCDWIFFQDTSDAVSVCTDKQLADLAASNRPQLVLLRRQHLHDDLHKWCEANQILPLAKPVRRAAISKLLNRNNKDDSSATGRYAYVHTQEQALRVLVVEDNPVNQMVLQRMLEKDGHEVKVANDGLDAMELLGADYWPDLILMDCQMPRLDGYETTARIREIEQQDPRRCDHRTPIVAVTANALKGDAERCIEAGMDGHIAKPINAQNIRAVVESVREHGQVRSSS